MARAGPLEALRVRGFVGKSCSARSLQKHPGMNRPVAAFFLLASLGLVACSSSSEDASFADGSGRAENSGASSSGGGGFAAPSDGTGTGSSSGGTTGAATDGPQPGTTQQSGQLTAGVWDDNLNYDWFSKYATGAESTLLGLPIFTTAEKGAAKDKFAQRTGHTQLDVAILFDTTGSMGDEIAYLQAEINGISQSITEKFPDATTRYGLVLYKDVNDSYTTKKFDFTDSISTFQTNLNNASAGGGGDVPEAAEQGLAQVNTLSWRTDASTARLTFWIADAPAHEKDASVMKSAIAAAAQNDVHIYPIAASGTDPRAEYTFRAAAQATGGRYIFVTDDSGIGGSHAEPHIPCYVVTRLDGAVVRMVESEMNGTHVEAAASEVLRTVGSPVDGQCSTQSSGYVKLY